jgi:hypothetical protein
LHNSGVDGKILLKLTLKEKGGRVRTGFIWLRIGLDKDAVCHVTQEALEDLDDFKVGGQIISTVRYADDLLLLAKEETVLESMIDKPIEVGRGYGMEINVEKTKTMRISRQPTPLQINR